ncbi:hypothetical protein PPSC2_28695 (plasmid) [Paenibacillus polymyxa SC2]|uniref:Uncharacterized protein n=1 Tax=Paenibacillus polymyxa (strain SC2) TaxID=886882 RepID=A0A0D5ZD04_PAEPS|nr:hypothetical protein PPSC2_28695 [Paenibacillus polymyxa SC2]
MTIEVDSKLIIGINRSLNSRLENKSELCFECGSQLDECCKNNVIQGSNKKTIYGYLCCSCKSENEALDDDLANDFNE